MTAPLDEAAAINLAVSFFDEHLAGEVTAQGLMVMAHLIGIFTVSSGIPIEMLNEVAADATRGYRAMVQQAKVTN
jgi:hypothetical protein